MSLFTCSYVRYWKSGCENQEYHLGYGDFLKSLSQSNVKFKVLTQSTKASSRLKGKNLDVLFRGRDVLTVLKTLGIYIKLLNITFAFVIDVLVTEVWKLSRMEF